MEPYKFRPDAVRAITEDTIQKVMNNKAYGHHLVQKWLDEIHRAALQNLIERLPLYHFITQCFVVQKAGGGLHASSSCFWDSNSDGMVAVRWENETMHVIVSIYGLANQ
jgi:dynein light chain Tctex-type 1